LLEQDKAKENLVVILPSRLMVVEERAHLLWPKKAEHQRGRIAKRGDELPGE
jgi:hypothetical protein